MTAAQPAGLSDLQWYLTRTGMAVHIVLASPEEYTEARFRALLARAVQNAPLLDMELSLSGACMSPAERPLAEAATYRHLPVQTMTAADVDALIENPASGMERSHARATCIAAAEPNADGVRSWLVLEAPHALVEGADVAAILRGAPLKHGERPESRTGLATGQRLGVRLIAPLLCIYLATSAWVSRRRRESFVKRRIVLDKAAFYRAARRLGVSKRALVFGLVVRGALVRPGKRRVALTYTGLAHSQSARDGDDSHFHLRIDELRHRAPDTGLDEGIRALARDLEGRSGSDAFMHAIELQVVRLQRRIDRWAPWLLPRWFFGTGPYDMVLSLLPPIRLSGSWLGGAGVRAYPGITGSAMPTCVIAVQDDVVALTIWADPETASRLDGVVEAARQLDIPPA